MRRTLLIAGVVLTCVGGLAILLLVLPVALRQPRSPLEGIDDSDIAGMRAALDESHLFKSLPAFSVPTDHIPRILFWFRPSRYVKQPPILPWEGPIGALTISTRQGDTVNLKFYWAGHNPPVFTENGVDYFYGGGTLEKGGHGVDGAIQAGKAIVEAWRVAKGDKDPPM
jgi:hypothetical protein